MKRKDYNVLEHMLSYCDRISEVTRFFGDSFDVFMRSLIYQDAVCMSILQIGELVSHLSSTFIAETPEIPWRNIRDARNFMAHGYGNMSPSIVWNTIKTSIPQLREFCVATLEQNSAASLLQQEAEGDELER